MKLSTRTRYGTRAMLDLALAYRSGPVSARVIGQNQGVSHKYLESLLAALGNVGLIRSVRGARGGHVLARPPDQITLREIFCALEGCDGFVHCTTDPQVCDRAKTCVTQEVWARMYAACMEILESTTLEDLADRAKKKGSSAHMYHI